MEQSRLLTHVDLAQSKLKRHWMKPVDSGAFPFPLRYHFWLPLTIHPSIPLPTIVPIAEGREGSACHGITRRSSMSMLAFTVPASLGEG